MQPRETLVIDIAKLKTHGMMGYSGAVKNLFGVVPGLLKPELHSRYPEKEPFAEMLVDLCEYVHPDFSIIDAIDARRAMDLRAAKTLCRLHLWGLKVPTKRIWSARSSSI